MAETKYGKYFTTYEGEQYHPLGTILSRLDDTVVKGSYFYFLHWVLPNPDLDFPVGHPPHIHKDAELLFHIGTNPDDPTDLGAEVELYMGPELERHVITKTTVVYIPPNFIHCPWKPLRTDRPWIFLEVNQGPMHTEKLYPQVLPKEIRDKVDWSKWKEEGFD
jgi:hypothetical protein